MIIAVEILDVDLKRVIYGVKVEKNKFSVNFFIFKPNFDPLTDKIFEKFQKIWKAFSNYFRILAGQIPDLGLERGHFGGQSWKKNIFGNCFSL